MALLTIGGVAQKTPSKMKISINDIDGETTRNAQGTLTRDRIATKRKIELEFPPLTHSQIFTLLSAVSQVFFTVTFLDPYTDPTVNGGMLTKTMYVGDRNSPILKFGNGTTDVLWEGLTMNLIEQ